MDIPVTSFAPGQVWRCRDSRHFGIVRAASPEGHQAHVQFYRSTDPTMVDLMADYVLYWDRMVEGCYAIEPPSRGSRDLKACYRQDPVPVLLIPQLKVKQFWQCRDQRLFCILSSNYHDDIEDETARVRNQLNPSFYGRLFYAHEEDRAFPTPSEMEDEPTEMQDILRKFGWAVDSWSYVQWNHNGQSYRVMGTDEPHEHDLTTLLYTPDDDQ